MMRLTAVVVLVSLLAACVTDPADEAGEPVSDGDAKADGAVNLTIVPTFGPDRRVLRLETEGRFTVAREGHTRLAVTGSRYLVATNGGFVSTKIEYDGWSNARVAMLVYARRAADQPWTLLELPLRTWGPTETVRYLTWLDIDPTTKRASFGSAFHGVGSAVMPIDGVTELAVFPIPYSYNGDAAGEWAFTLTASCAGGQPCAVP